MKYILITGSPLDGFIYEGPFDNPTSAGEYARKTSPRNSKYWVSHMREPQENTSRPISAAMEWKAEGQDKKLCKIVEDYLSSKEIRHKDGNPLNYDISNLELVPIKDSRSKEQDILDLLEASRKRNSKEFGEEIYDYYNKRKIRAESDKERLDTKLDILEIYDDPDYEKETQADTDSVRKRVDRKLADIIDNDVCTCDDDMCNPCIERDIADKADTDSYASSLPGVDYHSIMDKEDIPL